MNGVWKARFAAFAGGFAVACVAAWLALCLVRTSWLCDDAYITFRTVDNLVSGYGPVWNAGERVQAYTHPLWMFAVAVVYSFTREIYVTAQVMGIAITLAAALWLIFRLARTPGAAIVLVAALACSRAFVDYGTSGLENPLTYLLLAVFLAVYFDARSDGEKVLSLSFLTGLAVLNRMDLSLLFLPPLLFAVYRARSWRALLVDAPMGLLPVAAWLAFALLYYGNPFPNTAPAKLGTGVSDIDLARQGVAYFISLADTDPLTAAVIACSVMLPFLVPVWRGVPVSAGILLYLLYILSIGGDFMAGRYFSAPLLAAAALLALVPWRLNHAAPALLCLALLAFMAPYPVPLSDAHYGLDRQKLPANAFRDKRGVSDQRGFYYQATGLLRGRANGWEPRYEWTDMGKQLRSEGQKVGVYGATGFKGFYAGPRVYIIDYHALSDPLLARLPAKDRKDWHIGHFKRDVPAGYRETVQSGKNHLEDPGLAAYYEKLTLITRGPLFSMERLRAIWKLNTGGYDDLLSAYIERTVESAPPEQPDPGTLSVRPNWPGRRLTTLDDADADMP